MILKRHYKSKISIILKGFEARFRLRGAYGEAVWKLVKTKYEIRISKF